MVIFHSYVKLPEGKGYGIISRLLNYDAIYPYLSRYFAIFHSTSKNPILSEFQGAFTGIFLKLTFERFFMFKY